MVQLPSFSLGETCIEPPSRIDTCMKHSMDPDGYPAQNKLQILRYTAHVRQISTSTALQSFDSGCSLYEMVALVDIWEQGKNLH